MEWNGGVDRWSGPLEWSTGLEYWRGVARCLTCACAFSKFPHVKQRIVDRWVRCLFDLFRSWLLTVLWGLSRILS